MADAHELSFIVKVQDQGAAVLSKHGAAAMQAAAGHQQLAEAGQMSAMQMGQLISVLSSLNSTLGSSHAAHKEVAEAVGEEAERHREAGEGVKEHEKGLRSLIGTAKEATEAVGALWAASEVREKTIGAFMEAEQSVSNLRLALGLTKAEAAETFEGLERIATLNLGATGEQLAAVAVQLASLGAKGEEIESLTERMAQLATIGGGSAATYAAQVTKIIQATGETAESADLLAQQIEHVGKTSSVGVRGLAALTAGLAGATAGLKLSSGDLVGIVAGIDKAGVNTERGIQFAEQSILALQGAAKAGGRTLTDLAADMNMTSEEFKNLVKSNPKEAFYDFIEVLHRTQAAGGEVSGVLNELRIGGDRNIAVALGLAKNYDAVHQSFEAVGKTTLASFLEDLGIKNEQLTNRADTLFKTMRAGFASIGAAAAPTLIPFLNAATGAFRLLNATFGGMPPLVQTGIAAIILFAPAIFAARAAMRAFKEVAETGVGTFKGYSSALTGVARAAYAFTTGVKLAKAEVRELEAETVNAIEGTKATEAALKEAGASAAGAKAGFAGVAEAMGIVGVEGKVAAEGATVAGAAMKAAGAAADVGAAEFKAAGAAMAMAGVEAKAAGAEIAGAANVGAVAEGAAAAEAGVAKFSRTALLAANAGRLFKGALTAGSLALAVFGGDIGLILGLLGTAASFLGGPLVIGIAAVALGLVELTTHFDAVKKFFGQDLTTIFSQTASFLFNTLADLGEIIKKVFTLDFTFSDDNSIIAYLKSLKERATGVIQGKPEKKEGKEGEGKEGEGKERQERINEGKERGTTGLSDGVITRPEILTQLDEQAAKVQKIVQEEQALSNLLDAIAKGGKRASDQDEAHIAALRRSIDLQRAQLDPLYAQVRATSEAVAMSAALTKSEQNRLEIAKARADYAEAHPGDVNLSANLARTEAATRQKQEAEINRAFADQVREIATAQSTARALTQTEQDRLRVEQQLESISREKGITDEKQLDVLRTQLSLTNAINRAKAQEDQLNPVGAGQRDYQDQLATLNDRRRREGMSNESYQRELRALNQQTLDRRDPYAAQVQSAERLAAQLRIVGEYREADAKTEGQILELMDKGVQVTAQQAEKLSAINRSNQDKQQTSSSGFQGFVNSQGTPAQQMANLESSFANGLADAMVGALEGKRGSFTQFFRSLGETMLKQSVNNLLAQVFKVTGLAKGSEDAANAGKAALDRANEARKQADPANSISPAVQSMAVNATAVYINGAQVPTTVAPAATTIPAAPPLPAALQPAPAGEPSRGEPGPASAGAGGASLTAGNPFAGPSFAPIPALSGASPTAIPSTQGLSTIGAASDTPSFVGTQPFGAPALVSGSAPSTAPSLQDLAPIGGSNPFAAPATPSPTAAPGLPDAFGKSGLPSLPFGKQSASLDLDMTPTGSISPTAPLGIGATGTQAATPVSVDTLKMLDAQSGDLATLFSGGLLAGAGGSGGDVGPTSLDAGAAAVQAVDPTAAQPPARTPQGSAGFLDKITNGLPNGALQNPLLQSLLLGAGGFALTKLFGGDQRSVSSTTSTGGYQIGGQAAAGYVAPRSTTLNTKETQDQNGVTTRFQQQGTTGTQYGPGGDIAGGIQPLARGQGVSTDPRFAQYHKDQRSIIKPLLSAGTGIFGAFLPKIIGGGFGLDGSGSRGASGLQGIMNALGLDKMFGGGGAAAAAGGAGGAGQAGGFMSGLAGLFGGGTQGAINGYLGFGGQAGQRGSGPLSGFTLGADGKMHSDLGFSFTGAGGGIGGGIGSGRGPDGSGISAGVTGLSPTATLIAAREQFRATPYDDKGSLAIGYGDHMLNGRPVQAGDVVTKEQAVANLNARIPTYEGIARREIGSEAFDRLPANTRAALTSNTYNYGTLGKESGLIEAARSGDQDGIAAALRSARSHNGGLNSERREQEAQLVEGRQTIDTATGRVGAMRGVETADASGKVSIAGPQLEAMRNAGQLGKVEGDIGDRSTFPAMQRQGDVKGFVFHHTAPRDPEGNEFRDAGDVVDTLNQRHLSVNYVMDRDGKITRTLPDGQVAAQIKPSNTGIGRGLSNSNTEGMEIIAKNDQDVNAKQVAAAQAFYADYAKQHPGVQAYGHGELNSDKMRDEGKTVVDAIRSGKAPAPVKDADAEVAAQPKGAGSFMYGYQGGAEAEQAAKAARDAKSNAEEAKRMQGDAAKATKESAGEQVKAAKEQQAAAAEMKGRSSEPSDLRKPDGMPDPRSPTTTGTQGGQKFGPFQPGATGTSADNVPVPPTPKQQMDLAMRQSTPGTMQPGLRGSLDGIDKMQKSPGDDVRDVYKPSQDTLDARKRLDEIMAKQNPDPDATKRGAREPLEQRDALANPAKANPEGQLVQQGVGQAKGLLGQVGAGKTTSTRDAALQGTGGKDSMAATQEQLDLQKQQQAQLQQLNQQQGRYNEDLGKTNTNLEDGVQPLQGFSGGLQGIQSPLEAAPQQFSSFGSSLEKMLSQLGSGGGGGLGGLFGGGGGGGLFGGIFHDGGVVGGGLSRGGRYLPASTFAGAPRFHTGLMADEYPAVLQRGESVLTKANMGRTGAVVQGLADQVDRMGTMMQGAAQGGQGGTSTINRSFAMNMTVMTPDANSFRRSAGQMHADTAAQMSRYNARNN